MRNLKVPVIFAIFGFALSLLFGFFSRSHFGIIFLRALIFAVIFFAIGFAIKFIYSKFLNDDSSSDLDNDQLGSSDNSASSGNDFTKGQHVDFVVRDEELDSETSDNHYVVGQNHQMLADADVQNGAVQNKTFSSGSAFESANGSSASVQPQMPSSSVKSSDPATENKDSGFVPLGKESFRKVSGTEAVAASEVQSSNPGPVNSSESSGMELDVLPDMTDLQVNDSSESSEVRESDETDFEGSSDTYKSKNTSDTEVKDASLMAKAISSLLSAES